MGCELNEGVNGMRCCLEIVPMTTCRLTAVRASSSSMMCLASCPTAMSRAVPVLGAMVDASMPASSSRLTTCSMPARTAKCSAVSP